jgi:hypothetical protein
MNITLTEKEIEYLKNYAKVFDEERKRDITCDPVVAVEVEDRVPTKNCYSDGFEYIIFDGDYSSFDTKDELTEYLKEYYDYRNEKILKLFGELEWDDSVKLHDDIELRKGYYIKKYRPVAFFLTRYEADRYVEYQSHNLNNPRVFTYSAGYANYGEIPTIIKLLKRMGEELLNENNT